MDFFQFDQDDELSEAQEDLLDINEVMSKFGVQQWKNLGAVAEGYSGGIHLLVEIEGERYVFRERPEGMVEENLGHRYAFRRYLQQVGIPIPNLLFTPQGEPYVAYGDNFFELQQWVGGELFTTSDSRSLDWVSAAGTMLGRIHQASMHYTGDEHRWPADVSLGSQVQGWLQLARMKAEQSELYAVRDSLSAWVDAWEAVLPAAMMSIGIHHNLPAFHIHGDYHALNLRFGSFGVTAVMGVEASHWEKRIFEVAYALFYFSALRWNAGSGETRPLMRRGFDPERMRRFLRAYGDLCPPERGEAAVLADALLLVSPIASINGPLEDLFYTDGGRDDVEDGPIEDVLERLTWATSLPAWIKRVGQSLVTMWT
jgi:Ser/Thr protein kinase RdoA (MazF antagonist)